MFGIYTSVGDTGDKDPCTEPVYAEYLVILCLKY
jgi:hypothetical protein